MTLPTSYNNGERGNFFADLISVKYFKNYFKKDRILMLIMTICFFILSPLITFFMYTNSQSMGMNQSIAEYNRIIYCVIAVLCGIFLPLYLYGYNHSRKSSIFYNSLPIKKHTLYNTHALLGLVYFLVSTTINYIFVSLILFANSPESSVIAFHLKSYIINLIIFIAIYCMMIFVANIAGTLLSSIILYAYVNFYLCGWILITALAFEMLCSYTTFRITSEMFFNTSFIIYTISKLENMNILHTLLILAISAALYYCGILLNRRLKIEKAEHSIYFERFEQIFKYSMLAIGIIITGMAFYSSGGGFGYYIGSAFGGIAGLIILNIITRKNIKESFYKFKNFVIFFVIITVLSIPTVQILRYLDTYVPDADSIAYVESHSGYSNNLYSFQWYGNFYESDDYSKPLLSTLSRIKDKSAIEAIITMQKIYQQADKNNSKSNSYVSFSNPLSPFGEGFDYKFKNGYRLSKWMKIQSISTIYFNILTSSEYKDALYHLNTSEDYIKSAFYPLFEDNAMEKLYDQANNISLNFNTYVYGNESEEYYNSEEYYSIGESYFNLDKTKRLVEVLKKDIQAISSDKQIFSTIYDGILENNKNGFKLYNAYGGRPPRLSGNFKEYSLTINFTSNNNNGFNMEITINDYFTETLRFIDEILK